MPMVNRLRLLICAMALVAWSVGCSGDKPAPPKDDPPADTKDPAVKNDEKKPAVQSDLGAAKFRLTADELNAEKEKDGKAAAAKYHNAVVELSGTVARVGSVERRGQREIWLALKGSYSGLTCMMKDTKLAGKLALNQPIRLKGRVEVPAGLLFVVDCEIVELGPSSAIRVSAEDMAKEFTPDWMEAKKKYVDKTVVVTGVIEKKKDRQPGQWVVWLKGDGTTVIECEFPPQEEAAAGKLEVGQKVTLAGAFSGFNTGPKLAAMIDSLIVETP